jgi:hypothetical protein
MASLQAENSSDLVTKSAESLHDTVCVSCEGGVQFLLRQVERADAPACAEQMTGDGASNPVRGPVTSATGRLD